MPRLEEITVGSQVKGIAAGEPVTVIAVQWYGNAAAEITFKNGKGQLASQIVYREEESRLEVLGDHLPWSFDADANRMRLVSEAYRINLAHIEEMDQNATDKPMPSQNTHFFMSAQLDNTRINRDVQRLVEKVISHLTGVDGCTVDVSLEVNAQAPNGLPIPIIRTIMENCRTLKVKNFGIDN